MDSNLKSNKTGYYWDFNNIKWKKLGKDIYVFDENIYDESFVNGEIQYSNGYNIYDKNFNQLNNRGVLNKEQSFKFKEDERGFENFFERQTKSNKPFDKLIFSTIKKTSNILDYDKYITVLKEGMSKIIKNDDIYIFEGNEGAENSEGKMAGFKLGIAGDYVIYIVLIEPLIFHTLNEGYLPIKKGIISKVKDKKSIIDYDSGNRRDTNNISLYICATTPSNNYKFYFKIIENSENTDENQNNFFKKVEELEKKPIKESIREPMREPIEESIRESIREPIKEPITPGIMKNGKLYKENDVITLYKDIKYHENIIYLSIPDDMEEFYFVYKCDKNFFILSFGKEGGKIFNLYNSLFTAHNKEGIIKVKKIKSGYNIFVYDLNGNHEKSENIFTDEKTIHIIARSNDNPIYFTYGKKIDPIYEYLINYKPDANNILSHIDDIIFITDYYDEKKNLKESEKPQISSYKVEKIYDRNVFIFIVIYLLSDVDNKKFNNLITENSKLIINDLFKLPMFPLINILQFGNTYFMYNISRTYPSTYSAIDNTKTIMIPGREPNNIVEKMNLDLYISSSLVYCALSKVDNHSYNILDKGVIFKKEGIDISTNAENYNKITKFESILVNNGYDITNIYSITNNFDIYNENILYKNSDYSVFNNYAYIIHNNNIFKQVEKEYYKLINVKPFTVEKIEFPVIKFKMLNNNAAIEIFRYINYGYINKPPHPIIHYLMVACSHKPKNTFIDIKNLLESNLKKDERIITREDCKKNFDGLIMDINNKFYTIKKYDSSDENKYCWHF